jgi:histidinol-phosphate aminotransferase
MSDFNLDNLVRDNIKRMKPYSSARDEFKNFDTDMIFLDANENPFENGVNRYPDPQQRNLKAELAKQKSVSTENILLGNGSDEVLDLIFRAFCIPEKDNVITLPPTYGMYKVLAETNAIENREVLLNMNFQPNIAKILEALDANTKLLFICSPNNPTGNLFSTTKIEQLLTSFNGIIVIDEAYIDFADAESWITKLERFPNLIITQTLSKAYGLAGIRLGICFASSEIITVLNKIKPPYNVNELTQNRAQQRLITQKKVEQEVAKILEERNYLIIALEEVDYILKIYHTDANFVLVKVDDANKRYVQLIEKGIVVRNRTTQPLCENTLRFTVGTSEEIKKLTNSLKELE